MATTLYTATLKTTTGVPLVHSATVTLSWSNAVMDGKGFFTVSQPTRLRVGSGLSCARLTGNVAFQADASGNRQVLILKNGTTFDGYGASRVRACASSYTTECPTQTGIISVVSGDYFEMTTFHTAGVTLSAIGDGRTWFAIEAW